MDIEVGIRARFNPLHCGAVVASRRWSASIRRRSTCFNPLHCGAVVASRAPRRCGRTSSRGFNPLHCGAVVASRAPSRSARCGPRFNPLHCGAVVASRRWRCRRGTRRRWFQSPSLRGSGRFSGMARRPTPPGAFQSPSLRGSGRFGTSFRRSWKRSNRFNPLHCGAVVASSGVFAMRGTAKNVSIPFIAGQWSLRAVCVSAPPAAGGRFNPLHCGAVVASARQ